MTATQRPTRSAASRQAPAGAPRPERRPAPLRIVPPGERSPQARRRRRRLLMFGAASLVVVALFGVVVEHAILAEQQFRLSSLQGQAATEEARNQSLQLQVAELQSPSRVVSVARSKLGMVTPSTITYLAPGHQGPKVQGPAASATNQSTTAGQESVQAGSAPSSQP